MLVSQLESAHKAGKTSKLAGRLAANQQTACKDVTGPLLTMQLHMQSKMLLLC